MKRLSLLFILLLTSCNKQFVDLDYNFNRVHVFETGECYTISSWRDYDDSDQIQVKINGYGTLLFHANQIVLINGKCPFCEHKEVHN